MTVIFRFTILLFLLGIGDSFAADMPHKLALSEEKWSEFFASGVGCNIRKIPTPEGAKKPSPNRQAEMTARVNAVFERPQCAAEIDYLLSFLRNSHGEWNGADQSLYGTWGQYFFAKFAFDPKDPDAFIGTDLAVIAHLNGLIDEHELANVFMLWTLFKFHSAEGNFTAQFKSVLQELQNPIKSADVIKLFDEAGEANPKAVELISSALNFGAQSLNTDEKMAEFLALMKTRPIAEQRIIMLPLPTSTGTFTKWEQSIVARLSDMNIFLFIPVQHKWTLMPTAMMEIWLHTFFPHPVKIRPKFGAGTFDVVGRKSLQNGEREVLLRSPYQLVSNIADGHDAFGVMTSMHDYYHAIISSFTAEKYRHLLLKIIDRFMQEEPTWQLSSMINSLCDYEITAFIPESYSTVKDHGLTDPDSLFTEFIVNRINKSRLENKLFNFRILIDLLGDEARELLPVLKKVFPIVGFYESEGGPCSQAVQYIDSKC